MVHPYLVDRTNDCPSTGIGVRRGVSQRRRRRSNRAAWSASSSLLGSSSRHGAIAVGTFRRGRHVVAVIEWSRIMVKVVERIVRCGSEGLFPHWRFAGATVLG